MKTYENVYSFSVIDEIKNGNKVYIIDKAHCCQTKAIKLANEMVIEDLFDIINCPHTDGRYEFFKIIESEK